MNHVPTGEDISHLMKEFTVDFLLKGYGPLMTELKKLVLTSKDVSLDTSHFTWLIMFFLKFASQLEIDFEIIRFGLFLLITLKSVGLCNQKFSYSTYLIRLCWPLYLSHQKQISLWKKRLCFYLKTVLYRCYQMLSVIMTDTQITKSLFLQ